MAESSITESGSDAKIRHILAEAIYRQKQLFWMTFAGVMAFTMIVIVLIPRLYEADAKVLVQNLREPASLSTGQTNKVVTSDDVTETQMNSEVELIQSQAVARRALGLPAVSTNQDSRQLAANQEAVKKLLSHLTVEAVKQSNVINLKFTDSTPTEAIRKLNAIVGAYFDERADLTRASGAAEFFTHQAEQFGNKLDENRNELTKFESEHDLVDLNDQKKLQVQRIAALDDTLSVTRAHLAEQNGRSQVLLHELASTQPRTETTRRALTNQYSQEHLNTELTDLKNRRAELQDRYQPGDRAIVELDQKIAITQSAIQEAILHPAAETSTDINPLWQQAQTLLVAANAEISGSVAQQNELLRQRAAAEARLQELLQSTENYDALNRHFQEVQADYNIYVQKRDEARVGEALDKAKIFDVSLAQHPDSTMIPVRPKPIPYFLAGLLFALLYASALALYADSSAERIYAPRQLDAVTNMRTLATISRVGALPPPPGKSRLQAELPERSLLEYRTLLYSIRSTLNHQRGLANGVTIDDNTSYCVAFTSTLIGEGVSYVVRNLAVETVKQTNAKVALLNMKRLLNKVQAAAPIQVWLALNPASTCWEFAFGPDIGAEHPDSMLLGELQGQRAWTVFGQMLAKVRHEFAFMLLDCPSFRESTLAVELEGAVEGYIVVVSAGMVRKHQLEQTTALLKQTSTSVLGYVLNRRTYPVPPWLYKVLW